VPLEDGRAVVRFDPVALAPATALWGSLAFLAVALAAFLGSRIGSGVSADVSLATQEIDAMGVSDVLRGSPVLGLARYTSVRGLTSAIDRLGGVFREFAAAQERAISARAATERMRGLLLAAMSHDLKGPLNAILGFSALASRAHLSTGQRESLTIIEQRGKELLHLVETVLDAARVEAGQLALERHEAPAADVVMAAVLDARELGTDLGRTIEVTAPETLPSLRVDSARLSQGLTSLILAVARIATPGARVDVTTGVTDAAVSIHVATDGGAEAKAERDELFEAFRAPGLARKHGSLGLGVALARAIVEAHEGTLEATVADDGKLRFTATLPR
jgi:K+-sensing histidine kinase KdpD